MQYALKPGHSWKNGPLALALRPQGPIILETHQPLGITLHKKNNSFGVWTLTLHFKVGTHTKLPVLL
jgi:hypothetical protein